MPVSLNALGYDVGEPDGRFGAIVEAALRAWQRDLGIPDDGVARRGDIIYLPLLPARIALNPELVVGATLAGGEPAVQVLPEAPEFTIALAESQTRMVKPGMTVEIDHGQGDVWHAVIADVRQAPDTSESVATLASAADNAPICGESCNEVPLGESTLLPSVIHVVPETSGITVPAAAVVTTAANDTAVVLASGEVLQVRVIASALGTAVVEGVAAGEQVRTPGELPATTPPDRP